MSTRGSRTPDFTLHQQREVGTFILFHCAAQSYTYSRERKNSRAARYAEGRLEGMFDMTRDPPWGGDTASASNLVWWWVLVGIGEWVIALMAP